MEAAPSRTAAALSAALGKERLRAELAERACAEAKEMQATVEAQLRDLQQKLSDEVEKRMVAERERALLETQLATEGGERSQHQTLKAQLIEKMREVCSLQQQLTAELCKRQQVQTQLVGKEREVCFLQQQILGKKDALGTCGTRRVSPPPPEVHAVKKTQVGNASSLSARRRGRTTPPLQKNDWSVDSNTSTSGDGHDPGSDSPTSSSPNSDSTRSGPVTSVNPAMKETSAPQKVVQQSMAKWSWSPMCLYESPTSPRLANQKVMDIPLQKYAPPAAPSFNPPATTPTLWSSKSAESLSLPSWQGDPLCAAQQQHGGQTSRWIKLDNERVS